jgi:5-oxoprolinase (ATP-hydrolysing) subunit C
MMARLARFEDPMGLIVINAGLSATVQDLGRTGYREWGVPPGGAFDRGAAGLANALVGNSPDRAVLELTLVGGTYEARCPLAMAMAGAPMEAKVVAPDGSERDLRIPLSWTLRAGERLVLGRARDGARAYLAVRGGWQTRVRLGSRSWEDRLRPGDVLPAEPGSIPTRHPGGASWVSPTAGPLRILDGPDAIPADAEGGPWSFWSRRSFRVGSRSDRMGLRLEGEPVVIAAPPGRLSAPVAPAAVQVAGGQLIVLGIAGGTMGGYPHVAHVISADLDRLGQLRPGDVIRFRRVSLDEARRADRAMRSAAKMLFNRVATAALDV